jgi:DNA-binding GntR family transcriptional regulator
MNDTSSKPRGGSLTHAVYEAVRSQVLSGLIRPGQKLKIQDLMEQLEANKGAVREALSRLASEGLVIAEPQKGFRVRSISRAELLDLTQVRIGIESQCLSRALKLGDLRWESGVMAAYHELSKTPEKTIDPDTRAPRLRMNESWSEIHGRYHEALTSSCDSPWLMRLRAQLFAQAERYRRLSVPLESDSRDVNAEHRAIMEAAIARDAKCACELTARHFNKTTETLLQALEFDEDVVESRIANVRGPST